MIRIKTLAAALLLCVASGGAFAMTKDEIDAKWKELTAAQEERAAGSEKAAALRAELDSQIRREPLYSQWRRMISASGAERLGAAWSILRGVVPGGDVSRWAEVTEFELPSQTPRPFMVIDALYAALIELPNHDGGEWLAADLLKQFARSSHGRFDFLTTCPAPVAEALETIVSRTKLTGLWKPKLVIGSLPIARPVWGLIPYSVAINRDMQFLDAAGIPASNGFYAWDRQTGRIYQIALSDGDILMVKD